MAQLNKSSTRQLHSEDSTPVHPISCETVTETACTIQIHSALYMTQLNKSSTRQLHSEDSTPVHPIYTYIYIYICRYIHIQCNSKIHVSSGSAGYGTGTTHADICLLCFLFAYGLAASSYLHMGFLTHRVSLAQGPGPGFPDRH